nr:MAG TPA: Sigma-70, region 4 [Caudoviricetes sp.]
MKNSVGIKSKNSEKKHYLMGYRRHGRRIKRIEAEIQEIRSMKMYPSLDNDGMPHSHGQGDLSGYAAELREKEEELYLEGVRQVKEYKDISWKIQQLKSEDERDVLFYSYIKGFRFWQIAQELGYSERHIHRIHGRALENLKIS